MRSGLCWIFLALFVVACGEPPLPEKVESGAGDPGAGVGDPGGQQGDQSAGDPGQFPGDTATGDPGAGDPGAGDPGAGDPGYVDPGVEINVGWAGGGCSDAADCNDPNFSDVPICELGGFPGGFCTQTCGQNTSGVYICPDTDYSAATLNTVTRCIADAADNPRCASECDFSKSPSGCRPGYVCVLQQRYVQPDRIYPVCLPRDSQGWPGSVASAFDIGAPCAADSDCNNLSCMAMAGGYCTKTMCDFAGCPSGSECVSSSGTDTFCAQSCSSDGQCRTADNYVCATSPRICWPDPTAPTWDPSVGATDCNTAWGTAGDALSPCDAVKDDYVVVNKASRNLALCNSGTVVANFNIGLGFAATGDKEMEGDGRTPEGIFYVPRLVPASTYYRAFLLSYPDSADAQRGFAAGLVTAAQRDAIIAAQDGCLEPPQTTGLGGLIEIHGNGGGVDWTLGCIAIADGEVDQVWAALAVSDTIVVLP